MKKVKLSSLSTVSPQYDDNILVRKQNGQAAFIESREISSIRNYSATLGAGEEYAIPESTGGNIRVLSVLNSGTGGVGLIILGLTTSKISVIGAAALSLGVSQDGSESLLVYRKETNGTVFIKSNIGTATTIRLRTF